MRITEMILLPLLSMIVIFLLTKMMGYRQITQLSLYDYIIGITIGSIASELAVAHFDDFFQPVIAMVIFGIGTWLFSYLTRISPAIRNLVEGKAIVLFENGEINCQALKISKLDIDEFLMICRINGYFCLNDVDRIILETNGRFSFYLKTSARTLQVGDYQKQIQNEKMPMIFIKEGQMLMANLKQAGQSSQWLFHQLENAGCQLKDIELMYIDSDGHMHFYYKNNKKSYFI